MEQNVTDDLEILIAEMARHQARRYQCSLATATRQIRSLVAEAREEYRAAGALYGNNDQGFCYWLLARPHLSYQAMERAMWSKSSSCVIRPPLRPTLRTRLLSWQYEAIDRRA
jgi:hypothetical protein